MSVIPLKDNIPSATFPFVNYSLIIINVLIFIFQLTLGAYLEPFLMNFGAVPALFREAPLHPFSYIPIFTSMFLHGGLFHIFGNMLTLWIFGDNVEDRMGHFRYLLFYLLCGFLASLMHILLNLSSTLPSIGASGAIAGVMGAYLILYPRARVLTLIPIFFFIQIVEVPAFFFMIFWFIIQFFSGIATLGAKYYQQGGVAWWAHIGGFMSGLILVFIFTKKRRSSIYRTGWW